MRSRHIAGILGAALMAVPFAALTAGAQEAPGGDPPAGCGKTTTTGLTVTELGVQQLFGIDPDCVTFAFTRTPEEVTTETTAQIDWKAQVYGEPFYDAWSNWVDPTCELDGVDVDCASAATFTATGLAPGQHTFSVTARTEDPDEECIAYEGPDGRDDYCASSLPRSTARKPATGTTEISDGCPIVTQGEARDLPALVRCARVTGTVTWTVVAPQQTTATVPPATTETTPAATAPPVAAAATPPACLSRRGALTIRLRERPGNRIRRATVSFRGKEIAVAKRNRAGRLTATISFDGLPAGRFSLRIRATLADGTKVTFVRRYFTCAPKRPPSNNLDAPGAL